jgi:hypothetical protein
MSIKSTLRFFFFILLLGCANNEDIPNKNNSSAPIKTENTDSVNKEYNLNSTFSFTNEQRLILESMAPKPGTIDFDDNLKKYVDKYIQFGLNLDTSIGFNTKYFKEKTNNDNIEDYVITLNLLKLAKKKAVKAKNPAQLAQIGFMGDYNYVLFFDGLTCKITNETVIRSTPLSPLKITFENISSIKYKDILVDFRILNASYKDFYTVKGNKMERIFQWKNFDGLGKLENEAYHFKFTEGTMTSSKDILVYKANLTNPKVEFDKFTFDPTIVNTEQLFKRFFLHPERGIYMTR